MTSPISRCLLLHTEDDDALLWALETLAVLRADVFFKDVVFDESVAITFCVELVTEELVD